MADRFNIADVARIHGIQVIKETGSETYCVCPFCGDRRGKFSYIVQKGNKKNIYNCFKCNEHGSAVDLHEKLSMSDYSDEEGYKRATREIFEALNGDTMLSKMHQDDLKKVYGEEFERASDETISNTYYALLRECTLRPEHKADLLRRGLTETDIYRFKYKSTPKDTKGVCKNLIRKGYTLEGVPGFYKEANGEWNLKIPCQGYLCPAYDGEFNHIVGFQVRVDKPINDAKYLWISSGGKECGVSSGAPTTYLPGKSNNVALVTEGILKATIVYALLNGEITVYGVPGTKSINGLKPYLERLNGYGYLYEAYDMDKAIKTNDEKLKHKTEDINAAAEKLRDLLTEYNLCTKDLKWDFDKEGYWKEEFKGPDDFLLNYERRDLFISYLVDQSRDALEVKKYFS